MITNNDHNSQLVCGTFKIGRSAHRAIIHDYIICNRNICDPNFSEQTFCDKVFVTNFMTFFVLKFDQPERRRWAV